MKKFLSPTRQAIALAIAYALIACLISLTKHWSYHTYAFDLGIFSQSLWYTLEGNILYNSPEGMSHFGYHFQPILLLLVPIFWLAPHSETLLIVQSLALGGSGYLVYKLAQVHNLAPRNCLLVEGLFFISPLLHGVNFFDFHPVALAIPTLLIMILGLKERKWPMFAIGLILSLMIKEDVIAALGVFGAVMLLRQYLSHKRINKAYVAIFFSSIAAATLAIISARLASGLEIPPLLELGKFRYSYITQPPGAAIWGALGCLFSWQSMFLLLSYFLPLLFLPLVSLPWAAPVIFILGKDMLASEYWQKVLHQYPAPAIPFLFMGLIYALSSQKTTDNKQQMLSAGVSRMRQVLPIVAIVMAVLINLHPTSAFREVRFPQLHEEATEIILSLVPDGTTVTVPRQIFPHLCTRTHTYLPYEWNKPNKFTGNYGLQEVDTEYVIVDLRHMESYYIGSWEENIYWADYIEGKYGLVANIDGISLLKRGYSGAPIITELDATSGLNATVFSGEAFGHKVVEFQFLPPIQGDFTSGSIIPGIVPDEGWSMYLSGYIYAPKGGISEFHLGGDSSALLLVDSKYTLYEPGICPYQSSLRLALEKGFHKIELYYIKNNEAGHLSFDPGNSTLYRSLPPGASLANSQLIVAEGWVKTIIEVAGTNSKKTLITESPLQQGSIYVDPAEFSPALSSLGDNLTINIRTKITLDKDMVARFTSFADEYLLISIDGKPALEITPFSARGGEINLPAGEHTVEIQLNKAKDDEGLLYIAWEIIPCLQFLQPPSPSEALA